MKNEKKKDDKRRMEKCGVEWKMWHPSTWHSLLGNVATVTEALGNEEEEEARMKSHMEKKKKEEEKGEKKSYRKMWSCQKKI